MRPEDAYVLVIEDDANNLMIATQLLRMTGIKYINARASGWQGLKLAESLPQIDLILLDIQLPHEDGYEVLRNIRNSEKLREVRVVAVTANVYPQDEVKAREAGFNGFIGKPLDFDRFPDQIRALLNGEDVWVAR
ncbi:MAG TPA: response regulator [Herpetosiphonaceae bacterium]